MQSFSKFQRHFSEKQKKKKRPLTKQYRNRSHRDHNSWFQAILQNYGNQKTYYWLENSKKPLEQNSYHCVHNQLILNLEFKESKINGKIRYSPIYGQENQIVKLGPLAYNTHKISKWVTDMNIRSEIIERLEENTGHK